MLYVLHRTKWFQVVKDFYNCTYLTRRDDSVSMDTCLSQLNSNSSQGNETSVLTGPFMPESQLTVIWAMTVAAFALGGAFGGVSAGYFANKFGRYIVLKLYTQNLLLVWAWILKGNVTNLERWQIKTGLNSLIFLLICRNKANSKVYTVIVPLPEISSQAFYGPIQFYYM